MILNPGVDVHTKTQNHRKILGKTQKTTTYWKPNEHK